MILSPNEEREKHRRELELEIARTERSIAGLGTEINYCQRCLEIESKHLHELRVLRARIIGEEPK